MVIGNSKGLGDPNGQNFKRKYEAKLAFPEGSGGFKVKNHPWGKYGYLLEPHLTHQRQFGRMRIVNPPITELIFYKLFFLFVLSDHSEFSLP